MVLSQVLVLGREPPGPLIRYGYDYNPVHNEILTQPFSQFRWKVSLSLAYQYLAFCAEPDSFLYRLRRTSLICVGRKTAGKMGGKKRASHIGGMYMYNELAPAGVRS